MKRAARFRVFGRFGKPSEAEATVTIDRGAGLFSVRPLRRRRVYTLPLATVAQWTMEKVVRGELAERRAARRGRR